MIKYIIFILLVDYSVFAISAADLLEETNKIINENYVKELQRSETAKAAAKGIIASLVLILITLKKMNPIS
jgi:hypothetical protein